MISKLRNKTQKSWTLSLIGCSVPDCEWLKLTAYKQGSDTQVYPKNLSGFGVKPVEKPAPNLIQFQFVMPVIIKDFLMFTASNDH